MDKQFRMGMRIKVADGGPLDGATGTVVRVLRRSSYEAWVAMDEPIPVGLTKFPEGDDRHNHVCLDADDVEEVTLGKGGE